MSKPFEWWLGTALLPGLYNLYYETALKDDFDGSADVASTSPVLSMPNPLNSYQESPYQGPVFPGMSAAEMFPDVRRPSVSTPADVVSYEETIPSDIKADLGKPGSWWEEMFQTAETAAINQANRNEEAAYAAYLRSEQAADNAYKRARNLRKSQYLDAVESLKAAGLNPVLAASNGISGSSTTAPQANAPASSSSAASGIDGASLLQAIAAIVSSAGNLMKGISSFLPSQYVSTIFKGSD